MILVIATEINLYMSELVTIHLFFCRMINDVNPYLNGKLGGGPSFEKSLLRGGEQRQSWCADKWKDCTINRGMVVPNAKLEI